MARYERFTFLCDEEERRMIAALAKRLERTQSDAIRVVVREAAVNRGIWFDDPAAANWRGSSLPQEA